MTMIQKLLSELIGTFALVFCGTGAIVINEVSGGVIGHLGIALTFGLIVASMIFSLGDVSGAHLNPSVTLAFFAAKRFPAKNVLPYCLAQLMGALLASAILRYLFPESASLGATLPSYGVGKAIVLEFIMTFILVLVIFNVSAGSKEKGMTAAIAIGSVVALEALFGGPVSGASMNPVRSFAPAIVSGHTESLWIYLLIPTAAALVAVVVHTFLYKSDKS